MTAWSAILLVLPMLMIAAAAIWGSVLAFRGRKWWATWCMLLGSIGILMGSILIVLGQIVLMRTALSSSGGSASAMADQVLPMMILSAIGTLFGVGGGIMMASGFVGFCARSGATEQRAAELEMMVGELQARVPGDQG